MSEFALKLRAAVESTLTGNRIDPQYIPEHAIDIASEEVVFKPMDPKLADRILDDETRRYVGRDIVLVRRVLAHLSIRDTFDGRATIEEAATPVSQINIRGQNRRTLGYIYAAELDAIIREESLRARDIASASKAH